MLMLFISYLSKVHLGRSLEEEGEEGRSRSKCVTDGDRGIGHIPHIFQFPCAHDVVN